MASFMDPIVDGIDTLLAWLSYGLKQTIDSYCDLETAEDKTTLVAHDGSLVTVLKVHGVKELVGNDEFKRLHQGIGQSFEGALSRVGHGLQVLFTYDRDGVEREIEHIYAPAKQTARNLHLNLDDLFEERVKFISQYCASEAVYFVLWTRPSLLTKEQSKRAKKDKVKQSKQANLPPMKNCQDMTAGLPDLRNAHHSFVRGSVNDLNGLNLFTSALDVHTALREIRKTVDPDFTSDHWQPYLPGDSIPKRALERFPDDISSIMYPPLPQQIMPRDAERLDLRTMQIGDRIYSAIFIDLFPKDIKPFGMLLARTLPTQIPWRISYHIQSNGLASVKMKQALSAVLAFTSAQNRLLNASIGKLQETELNANDAVVRLKVATATWAPAGNVRLLRDRTSQLTKALQGWGNCETAEISGDPFGGIVSSMLGISCDSEATAAAAPLYECVYMLPITRPASLWKQGALLFRSPDGKPWPYQPGSSLQTTWIDILYARPGSGKSVLSNAINLGLCLNGGLKRLPRIAIIDIGPSSSGLISLLKEALPRDQAHFAAAERLRMTPEYSINPFDTQLGCRYPTPQERSFLVNFLTLLSTPLGQDRPYDGIADMAGMVVDELYKSLADEGNPYTYSSGLELIVDEILEEIGFVKDQHTTWWEVTDALFTAGFEHEALLAQRYAMPLLADAASICRSKTVEDIYKSIKAPTGESLIDAFARMVSSAVREYPILSRVTRFDLGDARVVSIDLDEVAKTGGEASDRQTAVMYMLARYVVAKNYYLTEDNIKDMPVKYHEYHGERINEIREDPKRIVFDEFHRTSKSSAVRDQVIVDMREGRKWKVQVALISQSIDDFDSVMIEFATSIFIMDAGPAQAIRKTTEVFGLSDTARTALSQRVHGPREGGSTFLAQFATKQGMSTQLLSCTIGPIELWAFSTTAEDAKLRNILYRRIGPGTARQVLARLFPSGSAAKYIEERLNEVKEDEGIIGEIDETSLVDQLADEITQAYADDPNVNTLPK